MTDGDSSERPRDERRPDDERDVRDERRLGDERDARDERLPGDERDGWADTRIYDRMNRHPLLVALVMAVFVSVLGFLRLNQIVDDNKRIRIEECVQRNMAWERAMGFVLTQSEDDEAVEILRQVGLVDCEGE